MGEAQVNLGGLFLITATGIRMLYSIVALSVILVACQEIANSLSLQGYRRFTADNPEVNFTFEYPHSWDLVRAKGYTDLFSVRLLGPNIDDDQMVWSIVVFYDSEKYPVERERAGALFSASLDENLEILRDTAITIDGIPGIDLELTSDVAQEDWTPGCDTKDCLETYHTRRIGVEHLGKTYSIFINAGDDIFSKYTDEIEHFLSSFRFTDQRAVSTGT